MAMTQKIMQTLQKVSPQSRCVWGALFIVVMVHLLLAVLFKHTPQNSQENVSELPRVGRIVLSDKGNEALVKWLEYHDPSVMTAVDPVLGYSRVMETSYQRSEPEDLPNLLQPVMPQKVADIYQVGKLKISSCGLLPEKSPVLLLSKANKANPMAEAVTLNGEYSEVLSRMMTEFLAEYSIKNLQDMKKQANTELEIMPGRLADTGVRVILKKSSGSLMLDEKALEVIYRSIPANSSSTGYYGNVEFIWSNAAVAAETLKEQKL